MKTCRFIQLFAILLVGFVFLLGNQVVFAGDPCNFSSYADFSDELAALVENSTPTYVGNGLPDHFSCSYMGKYRSSGDSRVIYYYSVTQGGYDYCAQYPDKTSSTAWGRFQVIDFNNGCIPPEPDKIVPENFTRDCGLNVGTD